MREKFFNLRKLKLTNFFKNFPEGEWQRDVITKLKKTEGITVIHFVEFSIWNSFLILNLRIDIQEENNNKFIYWKSNLTNG